MAQQFRLDIAEESIQSLSWRVFITVFNPLFHQSLRKTV